MSSVLSPLSSIRSKSRTTLMQLAKITVLMVIVHSVPPLMPIFRQARTGKLPCFGVEWCYLHSFLMLLDVLLLFCQTLFLPFHHPSRIRSSGSSIVVLIQSQLSATALREDPRRASGGPPESLKNVN